MLIGPDSCLLLIGLVTLTLPPPSVLLPPLGHPAAWLQISWKPAACHHTVAVTQRETRPTVHIHIQSMCNNRPPFISDQRREASGGSITWRSGVRRHQVVVSLTFPPGFKGKVQRFGIYIVVFNSESDMRRWRLYSDMCFFVLLLLRG